MLEKYSPNDKSTRELLLQEKYFKMAMRDDADLCDAFVIYKVITLKSVSGNFNGTNLKTLAKTFLDINPISENGDKDTVLGYVNAMLEEGTSENDYCKDVEKMVMPTIPEDEPLGYINEEIQRDFILKIQVNDSDVHSNIDSALRAYSKVFNLSTFEFQRLAKTNRIGMIEGLQNRVYNEGDLLLMDQFSLIYNSILDWR